MHVLIASQNSLIRHGIKDILSGFTDWNLEIAFIKNTEELVHATKQKQVDILLLDHTTIPFKNELKKSIQTNNESYCIVLAAENDVKEIVNLFELGVDAMLTHDCDQDELYTCIRSAPKKEKFYCQKMITLALSKTTKVQDTCIALQLTEREIEIIRWIAAGKTNKEIGETLCISPHTVHSHRKSLMKKLGANSASDVTRFAVQEGLVN